MEGGSYRCRTGQYAEASFPLTLTLSLREREQPATIANKLERLSPATTVGNLALLGAGEEWRRILPLPKGEGRGEGKRERRKPRAVRRVENPRARSFHSVPPTNNAARCASS